MGLLDKIKMHSNVKEIMRVVRSSSTEQSTFDINLKFVLSAIYALNNYLNFDAYMDPARAACYCVESYEDGKPFYALFYVKSDTGEVCKKSKEITQFVAASLKSYKSANYESNNNNAFYNTAAEVLAEINKAIKGGTLVGFVNDKNMADKFETFEYTEYTSVDDLNAAWRAIDNFGSLRLSVFTTPPPYKTDIIKSNILKKVLGRKWNIAANVIGLIITGGRPFKTIRWKIIVHQLQYDEPIDKKAFTAVVQYTNLSSALTRIDDLTGLNFGKSIQVDTIKLAASLGDEYVDGLHTQDGWLSEVEMEKKYKEFQDLYEQKRKAYYASPEGQRERQLYEEMLERSAQEDERMLQERNLQKEIERQQENMAIRVQIAELKAQIQLIKTGPNAYDINNQLRAQALEKQCRELERHLK